MTELQLFLPVLSQTTNNTLRNDKLEIWIKDGAVYYPGSSGSVPANGAMITMSSSLLQYPINTYGYNNIVDYIKQLETNIEATASKPAGFGITMSVASSGLLTISSTHEIRLNMKLSTSGAIVMEGMATMLGFSPNSYTSSSSFATSHTGTSVIDGFFSTTISGNAAVEEEDIIQRIPTTSQFYSLSGNTFISAIGSKKTFRKVVLNFLSEEEKDILYSFHAKGCRGWPMYYYAGPFDWDVAYGEEPNVYMDQPTRDEFVTRRLEQGLAYWRNELNFVDKIG